MTLVKFDAKRYATNETFEVWVNIDKIVAVAQVGDDVQISTDDGRLLIIPNDSADDISTLLTSTLEVK